MIFEALCLTQDWNILVFSSYLYYPKKHDYSVNSGSGTILPGV